MARGVKMRNAPDTDVLEAEGDLRLLMRPGLHPGLRAFLCEYLAGGFFSRPISWQRWRIVGARVSSELSARARACGISEPAILQLETAAALHLAVSEIEDTPDLVAIVRTRVESIVTAAFCGPGWRETSGEALEQVVDDASSLVDASRGLERLNRDDPVAAELLAASCAGLSIREIADRWGWTVDATKQRIARAKKKIESRCHFLPVSADMGIGTHEDREMRIEFADGRVTRTVYDYPEARELFEREARKALGSVRECRSMPTGRRDELAAKIIRALEMPDSAERAKVLDELDSEARRSIAHSR